MTFLGIMRIINLAQDAINLVAQFVKIVFKILTLYLYNQV